MSFSVRSVGSTTRDQPNTFTPQQHHIQQILAVTSASISIVLALLSFYFFVKVKPLLFRHHLIILLIASDLFKAIWYFVPPVAIFAHNGPTPQVICQASGFLLAVGIEASDFIILLIAIHTALSVLRPRRPRGLHSYRYIAYACWAGFSILLPGLAFVDHGNAYVSQGAFCYLPVRPVWYRLILSWIPRYLILAIIIGIYMIIYLYTRSEFSKVDINLTSSSISGSPINDEPSSPTSPDGSPRWFGQPQEPRRSASTRGLARTTSADIVPGINHQEALGSPTFPLRRKQTFLEAFRDRSFIPLRKDRGPTDVDRTLRKRHRAIRRQLRYMFIYPMVYAIVWFLPFINHCYFYTREYNPPFVLNCLALVSLSLQCAVDCLIFGIREKPWRYHGRDKSLSRRRPSSVVNKEFGIGSLTDGPERVAILDHAVAEGVALRPERNWWDNEVV